MVLNASNVRNTLSKHVVNIDYRNHDGVKRTTRCTLNPSILPQQTELEEFTPSDRILLLWDVNQKQWVVVDLEMIINFSPEV